MRSIERRFANVSKTALNASTYIIFARTVKDQHFSKRVVSRAFKKLVHPDDYARPERIAIINFLWKLSQRGKSFNQGVTKKIPKSRRQQVESIDHQSTRFCLV